MDGVSTDMINIRIFFLILFFPMFCYPDVLQNVFTCFGERLNIESTRREAIADKIVDLCNLKNNNITRLLVMDVIKVVCDRHVNSGIQVDKIVNEIILTLDALMNIHDSPLEKHKKSGFFKKRYLLILFVGIAVTLTIYFAIRAKISAREYEGARVKVAEKIASRQRADVAIDVRAGLGVIYSEELTIAELRDRIGAESDSINRLICDTRSAQKRQRWINFFENLCANVLCSLIIKNTIDNQDRKAPPPAQPVIIDFRSPNQNDRGVAVHQ